MYLEHSGRGRKPKTEDGNDQSNVLPKKRAAAESKYLRYNVFLPARLAYFYLCPDILFTCLTERSNAGEGPLLDDTVVSSGTSSDTPGRFLLARTFAGEYVGIKLDVDRPKSFENEKTRAQWDWATARKAMKLKAQLESGEILPDQVKDSLDFNVHVPEEEKRVSKDGSVHRKTYKLRYKKNICYYVIS